MPQKGPLGNQSWPPRRRDRFNWKYSTETEYKVHNNVVVYDRGIQQIQTTICTVVLKSALLSTSFSSKKNPIYVSPYPHSPFIQLKLACAEQGCTYNLCPAISNGQDHRMGEMQSLNVRKSNFSKECTYIPDKASERPTQRSDFINFVIRIKRR